MKAFLIAFLIGIFSLISQAQTVQDIRVEQEGSDKGVNLVVYYKIANSNNKQLFDVTISCLVNNAEKKKLQFVTGDVGSNIPGGKQEYKVVWDVLKEVDELTSAEFFVDIVLKKAPDNKPVANKQVLHPWWVSTNSTIMQPFGVRLGYVGNWGAYVAFRYGDLGFDVENVNAAYNTYVSPYTDDNNVYHEEVNINGAYGMTSRLYSDYYSTFAVTAGVTKRLYNQNRIELHIYAGAGVSNWDFTYEYGEYQGWFFWDPDPKPYTLYYEWYDEPSQQYLPGYYILNQTDDLYDIDGNYVDNLSSFYNQQTRTEKPYVNVELEVGLMLAIKRFTLSAGYSTCWFYRSDVSVGVGYRF